MKIHACYESGAMASMEIEIDSAILPCGATQNAIQTKVLLDIVSLLNATSHTSPESK